MLKLKQTLKHSRQLLSLTSNSPISQTFQYQTIRTFALFKGKTQQPQGTFQQNDSLKTYDDILKNIQHYENSIKQKTQKGVALSQNIAQSVEENKYKKIQRYEIFIDKMHKLYKNEVRYYQKQKKKLAIQRNAILYSLTPLKDILKNYNDLTTRGFNSEAAVETLQNIQKALRARGYQGRPLGDYSLSELDQSWKMQKLVDDIKFGLRPDQFFNPQHLAQTSIQLGQLGYKNTELLPVFFDKLKTMIEERDTGKQEQTELKYEDAVYGGFKNFVPRHYVFKGFQNNIEFNEYIKILLEWETEKPSDKHKQEQAAEAQAEDLQNAMNDLVNAAIQVKELQKDFQSSIENIRQQYFLMQEATDKHKFIQDNQYIKYDLLELQEKLVQGGFLDYNEATKVLANEPFESRMNRAADVFYDYVINYAPELISPQYNSFYTAAINSLPKNQQQTEQYLQENQTILNLSTLSQTLVGLSEQALSYRRDVLKNDYQNKFYEQYLMPLEQKPGGIQDRDLDRAHDKHILMEPSYLKAWKTFKQETEKLFPKLQKIASKEKYDLKGQLNALNAIGACRFDDPYLRSSIVHNCINLIEGKKEVIDNATLISGLKGLALSPQLDDKCQYLAKQLANQVQTHGLTFTDQVDLLWSLCNTQQYDSQALQNLVSTMNEYNFERIEHDIKYDEFNKLLDIHNALKFEAPNELKFMNQGLLDGLNASEHFLQTKFPEHNATYDPFKQRVVQALAKGLTDASIDNQMILENELYYSQKLDQDALNQEIYPYKPDLIMGYKGQKVGIFVLPEKDSTRDTYKALGNQRFRMRILQSANKTIKCAQIAVNDVVKYDIENLKINFNDKFNFQAKLDKQLQIKESGVIDASNLSAFGLKMIQNLPNYIESLNNEKEIQKLNAFAKKLYEILLVKNQCEVRFDQSQKNASFDQLKFHLLQADLLYDSLNQEAKNFLDEQNKIAQNELKIKDILYQIRDQLPLPDSQKIQSDINRSWLGTRQEVEVPANKQKDPSLAKSLVPEIINQRFMWVDDYFHYDDWRIKQKSTFDNFNLLVVPTPENAHKFFFNQEHHHRRIPQGIFPQPNFKRQLMLPSANTAEVDLLRSKNHDDLILFEKEPYKMMVLNEIKKSEKLSPIDNITSMITNLQNIKQGLKSDYSDRDILNIILLNLNFTEELIEEHLATQSSDTPKRKHAPEFLPRNSSEFRRFIESTYFSKDREDPYTHFYLKESQFKESIFKMIEEEKQYRKEVEDVSADQKVVDAGNEYRKNLQDKIDEMLLQKEMQDEDIMNISSQLKQNIKVNYDLKSLIKSEFVYDVDPDLIDKTLSDDEYLNLFRRRAEAKLIKMKIIFKLHQTNQELTPQERKYLKKWVKEIQTGDNVNLLNLRDTLVPKKVTTMTLGDLEAKNLYTLNSISRVEIDRDKHGKYSISDLIVELSHFLDEEIVNKIQSEIYSEKMKKDWKLSKDFKAIETRNKEIGIVLNELEEVAWRSAGMINDKDLDYLKRMMSIKRNKDYFDKQFYDNDMRSFEQFVQAANTYDNRIELIERWLVRKEEEIKKRVNIPPQHLNKPDQQLHEMIDGPLKRARERLVAKLLIADEHGNAIEKEYKHLTSKELHSLVENLSIRIYLFNYDYPKFLPQAIKAIMEHPNLLKSDKDHLDLYCKMFELDWKADKDLKNREEFMFNNPIYIDGDNIKAYGELTNDVVTKKIQKACVPYVEELTAKILRLS